MQLTLTHTQRLNLHFIAGSQRGTVDEIRSFWGLQDMVQLSAAEKEHIGYTLVRNGDGSSYPRWDVARAEESKPLEFAPEQVDKLRKMVNTWPTYSGNDRAWLEPLLEQLNGAGPHASS